MSKLHPEYNNYTCECKLPQQLICSIGNKNLSSWCIDGPKPNLSRTWQFRLRSDSYLSRIRLVQLAGTRLMHVAARSSRKIDVHGWCSSQIHGSCIYQLAQLSQDRRTRPNGEAHDLLKTRSTTLLYTVFRRHDGTDVKINTK